MSPARRSGLAQGGPQPRRVDAPVLVVAPVDGHHRHQVGVAGPQALDDGVRGVDVDPDAPPLLADRIQIQQVLINFVMNAMQAIDAGDGETGDAGRGRITVRAFGTGTRTVRIEVGDTGVGVPEDEMGRLFETFYTTKKDGLGIGLPICRSIVEAHAGTISVARNADRGMVMGFELPTSS